MERLGLGPDECLAANPRLVYGRMTGWGQEGPMARRGRPRHQLHRARRRAPRHRPRAASAPVPPLNLVGDFGGGGMYLAFGVVCALLEAGRSGRGQVVDAAMVDGAASLAAAVFGLRAKGMWNDERGDNILDSGAPWYDVYETQDGKYVAIGSIEGRFYGDLLRLTGLTGEALPPQWDKARWGELRARFTEVFKQKTRDEWGRIMEGSDVCFAPVPRWRKRPPTRTTARAGPSWKWTACRAAQPGAPLQPHAGRHQAARRRHPASTPRRRSATGASPPTSSPTCAEARAIA